MLNSLRLHKLVAKRNKCRFGQMPVNYLGHVISEQGLSMDSAKNSAIQQWHKSKNVKEVRSFLGLAGYYRRFIHHYAAIAGPLTDLLRKDYFHWSPTAQVAFETLKSKLGSTRVLALPDFNQEFQLETDASGLGIGVVLSQKGHPVAYFSHKLTIRMQGASTYHWEMFVITQAVSKWHQYLLGRRFTIYTNHQSPRSLTNQTIQTPEQQKWLSKLVGFDFQIIYRPGKLNQAVDSLSRTCDVIFLTVTVRGYDLECELMDLNQTHPGLLALQQSLQNPNSSDSGFQFRKGLLVFCGRLVIPADSPLRHKLLYEFHDTSIGGHASIARTYHRMPPISIGRE